MLYFEFQRKAVRYLNNGVKLEKAVTMSDDAIHRLTTHEE